MSATRTCSECPNLLHGRKPHTKTCSNACRLKRSRRIRRGRVREEELAAQGTGAQQIAAIVRHEAQDVITRVMHQELQPIVREALTEDVLRAVQQMLGLTPRAVELLQADLESEDSTVRQRAYTLVTKYTIGHPALLKPVDTEATSQMVVQFNLPRPDAPDPVLEPEPAELRACDMCHEEKLAEEFVSGSDRCQPCFDRWRETVLREFQ